MKVRNKVEYIKLFLKGVFMGIADAVPGVSGGTIALLLGIITALWRDKLPDILISTFVIFIISLEIIF